VEWRQIPKQSGRRSERRRRRAQCRRSAARRATLEAEARPCRSPITTHCFSTHSWLAGNRHTSRRLPWRARPPPDWRRAPLLPPARSRRAAPLIVRLSMQSPLVSMHQTIVVGVKKRSRRRRRRRRRRKTKSLSLSLWHYRHANCHNGSSSRIQYQQTV
jgi:hypothetical protein